MRYTEIYQAAYQESYNWNKKLIEGKSKEEAIKRIEILERQKYHYYIDCSDRWTTEEEIRYNASWDAIIAIGKELTA